MAQVMHGVIHGKTIELQENPGFSDGEEIEVVLRPRGVSQGVSQDRPGTRPTAAGMLAHLPAEVDTDLDEIVRDRKRGVFREIPQ
jgi:hypothetical protein